MDAGSLEVAGAEAFSSDVVAVFVTVVLSGEVLLDRPFPPATGRSPAEPLEALDDDELADDEFELEEFDADEVSSAEFEDVPLDVDEFDDEPFSEDEDDDEPDEPEESSGLASAVPCPVITPILTPRAAAKIRTRC